jgi:hypothetical protein
MGSGSRPGGGWLRGGAVLLLALLGGGALATAVGAARYPGGSWVDPRSPGHSVWGNFLCDIARDLAVNGQPNPGAPWGRAAEWAFVLALCLFWWLVPALLAPRWWPRVIPALGTLSTLGLLGVPVTVDVGHLLALVAGAGPGFAAGGLVVRGLQARPWLALLGAVALLLAALELGLFLAFQHVPPPVAVPAMQRLALLAAVGWMGGCAGLLLRRRQEDGATGVSSTGSPRAT